MNTQDTAGQADPRYWTIRDYEKIYGDNLNNPDGISIYDCDACDIILEIDYQLFDIDTAIKEILDYFKNNEYELDKNTINDIKSVHDMSSLESVLKNISEYEFSIMEYEKVPVDHGIFLTHEAAIQHLKNNEYHYSEDAHTYANTAWRSSEEKLWTILQTVDFDKLLKN